MRARTPTVEWRVAAARGDARPHKLTWVDGTLDPEQRPYQLRGTTKKPTFRGGNWERLLPPPLVSEAQSAQQAGLPTLVEGLHYLFAWADWSVQSRAALWSAQGWDVGLLSTLADAYGIDQEVHRGDAERLARLVARLPAWFPQRGQLDRSLELWSESTGEPLHARYESAGTVGDRPEDPPLRDEVFACRSASWWRQRPSPTGAQLRISAGWLRFQPTEGETFPLSPEDVLVSLEPSGSLDRPLLRLLSPGTCLRIVPLPAPESAS